MIKFFINGKPVYGREDATILEASYEDRRAASMYEIYIPFLQYLKGVNPIDESGLCQVEVEGKEGLVNASTTRIEPGMQVTTDSPAIREEQTRALQKILDCHDVDCKNCLRTGNCELQQLQLRFRMNKEPAEAKRKIYEVDETSLIIRDDNKCVRCGRCIAACHSVQGIDAIKMEGDYLEGRVVTTTGNKLSETNCVNCGQCIVSCPVGALRERDDTEAVFEAIADPDKYVVVQAAPSIRASVGEYFGFPIGSKTVGKLAAALRALGFDKVFDTTFGADLTIMEEACEFVDRLNNDGVLPMTTSCCPSWIQFCEQEFPQLIPNISSCKSPHQMSGAVIKSYLAEKEDIAIENIVVVSAMPCTSKKFEITRENMNGAGMADVDYVLTVREICHMIEKAKIPFIALEDETFDSPLGEGSGAGVIFGATGGVMEAALRTAADILSGESLEAVEYQDVRGVEGCKEATVTIGGKEIKVAVVSGLTNARVLAERVKTGNTGYSFIEVMSCPGGCVNGGGQPQQLSSCRIAKDLKTERADILYGIDNRAEIRKAHENPEIQTLYRDYLEVPGSEKAHALLHTAYTAR